MFRITFHHINRIKTCGGELDIWEYCIFGDGVVGNYSMTVFLGNLNFNQRISAGYELEKYDREASSEDVVVTCEVVFLTNYKHYRICNDF